MYRPKRLELKPLSRESLRHHSDSECADISTLEHFELPPPAIVDTCPRSERLFAADVSSDSKSISSSDDYSESMFSVSSGYQTYTHSSETQSKTSDSSIEEDAQDDSGFLLPPAVISGNMDEVLRPTLNRKSGSYDGKKTYHPESILNFLQNKCALDKLQIDSRKLFGWSGQGRRYSDV